MNKKDKLRSHMAILRNALSSYERENANDSIFNFLYNKPEMKQAGRICLYVSLPEEVDTHAIITTLFKEKRDVIVPRVTSDSMTLHSILSYDDLIVGSYDIKEPGAKGNNVSLDDIDLFVVPGIAFDRHGYRLGRGKGYYDRLLSRSKAIKIGLAFSCQIVSRLPRDIYDIPMDVVITEKETITI